MSHHRFTNLREVLNGDLSGKIMDGIESRDMQNLDCNCRGKNKNGCDYGGFCRDRIIVYENKCKLTGKCYVGQTQQHCKSRMQQRVSGSFFTNLQLQSEGSHVSQWEPNSMRRRFDLFMVDLHMQH